MRLIRRRRVRPRKKLDLRVDVIQARDLVLTDSGSTIMVAGLALNGRTKRTKKVKRTANPTWNGSFRLPLSSYDGSDVLCIAVFDKHRRYANYLGELRLSLTELLTAQNGFKCGPQWYKLKSSSSEHKFVTGSIQLSLEVMCKSAIEERYNLWKQSLVKRKAIVVDDQDFYTDDDTDENVESLLLDTEEDTPPPIGPLKISPSAAFLEPPQFHHYDSTSDLSLSDTASSPITRPSMSSHNSTTSLSSLRKPPQSRGGSQISGVVFLHILSASDLPPYKGALKQRFDMDPFVVISFGKKTFRTSWRKHTLSPTFNQRLAFEVVSNEQHFDLIFTIMDKDRISFHDKVAEGYVPVKEVIHSNGEKEYNLKMKLYKSELEQNHDPHLLFKVQFKSFAKLQAELWDIILSKYNPPFDLMQIEQVLEDTQLDEDFATFFSLNGKTMEDTLTVQEMKNVLSTKPVQLQRCPICNKKRFTNIVSHVAICSAKGNKLKSFATTSMASKRWYSKVLIKMVYGKYALGKNNANILVQDRETGFIIEEKMALYIRLGIRMLYKGKGADSRRIKNVLKNMSVKQGIKFDNPASVKDIESFIKFYKLDLSECEPAENWKTFNQFFYRKLKPGMRPAESPSPYIVASPADCRCTAFNRIDVAQEFWIKGRSFTVKKLLGDLYSPKFEGCAIGIFRLAPQDYHRFHSPVDATVGDSIVISGEYYTVNPMAIRSELDVFGENVRVVTSLETSEFGQVMFVAVGAMMVGSTVMTVEKGQRVKRTDELGYFKFGGSTVLVLFQPGVMAFDSDLTDNSEDCVETLVRVGMSVGHHVEEDEFPRAKVNFKDEPEETKLKIIRTITGGDEHVAPWEYYNLNVNSDDVIDEENDEDGDEEDDEEDDDVDD